MAALTETTTMMCDFKKEFIIKSLFFNFCAGSDIRRNISKSFGNLNFL